MTHSIYVVVLNCNNYTDTRECIESIRQSLYPIDRIILVDNGSRDNSIEKLEENYRQSSKLEIIRNRINEGFARGVNVGIRRALDDGAEYILLVNNDAIIDMECVTKLCKIAERSDDVGIVGPRIFYFTDNERIWQGGGYFSKLKSGIISPEKNRLAKQCADVKEREVAFLSGCVMLVRRMVFERIGLFNEDLFIYEEDVEFCLRARTAGFRISYVPSARAWHKINNIVKDRTSSFVLYHLARSHLIMLRKSFPPWYFLYGFVVHLLVYTPYRMWQILQGSRSLNAALSWLKGTIDGLLYREFNFK